MHFIILKLNVHKIKLNQDSKMANLNYKVQNCKFCDILFPPIKKHVVVAISFLLSLEIQLV